MYKKKPKQSEEVAALLLCKSCDTQIQNIMALIKKVPIDHQQRADLVCDLAQVYQMLTNQLDVLEPGITVRGFRLEETDED